MKEKLMVNKWTRAIHNSHVHKFTINRMVHNSQSEQEVHKFIGIPDFNIDVISMTRRYRIDSIPEHSRKYNSQVQRRKVQVNGNNPFQQGCYLHQQEIQN